MTSWPSIFYQNYQKNVPHKNKPTCIFHGILVKNWKVWPFEDGLIHKYIQEIKMKYPIWLWIDQISQTWFFWCFLAPKILGLSSNIYGKPNIDLVYFMLLGQKLMRNCQSVCLSMLLSLLLLRSDFSLSLGNPQGDQKGQDVDYSNIHDYSYVIQTSTLFMWYT